MILDVIIGFEPASLLWFVLVNGFLIRHVPKGGIWFFCKCPQGLRWLFKQINCNSIEWPCGPLDYRLRRTR